MSSRRFIANGVPAKKIAGGKKSSIEGGLNPFPDVSAATDRSVLERTEVSSAYSRIGALVERGDDR
jgi:hypothetical protein